jgi:hypothetical protein
MMTGNDKNAKNEIPVVAFCSQWSADSDMNGNAWQSQPIVRNQASLRERRMKGRFRSPMWRVYPSPLNTL